MANTSGLTADNTPLSTDVTANKAIIRGFGGFTAEVVVKESHHDEMTITSHPVEKGAAISDHAFANPAQLTLVAGWSARFEALRGQAAGIGLTLNDLYASLLAAQKAATLMEVQTGKRLYHNMLIRSLAIETDQTTENALMVTIQLQEVILVETKQTTLPPSANRKNPKSTNGVTNTGTKRAIPYTGKVP